MDDFKDGILKFDFMSSLQKITMAKIVTSLWINEDTQQDIIRLIKSHAIDTEDVFSEIEENVVAKVSQLQLPDPLCQEFRCLVSVLQESIINWIQYLDDHILSPKESEYSAVDLIHNITWTTRGKIDYVLTAKKILANSDSCLSDDHKYKLACNFCLEDEIVLLGSKLVNQFYLLSVNIDKHPMVYFWTAHITGDRTPLNNPSFYRNGNQNHDDMSINEHIMQLLITKDLATNDVSIRFMWNQLSNEEKNKNISFIFENHLFLNPDFLISLFSNLDYNHQQNVLEKWSVAVLCAIINDYWWWEKYFLPTALHVLGIMDSESFWFLVFSINYRKSKISRNEMYNCYKSLFKCLWQECSIQLKEGTSATRDTLGFFVTSQLDWERDADIIEVMIKDLSAEQKRELAFCWLGIQKCVLFIEGNKYIALDFFIKSTLSSEEDVNRLKQRVIQDRGKEIAIRFLSRRQLSKMDHFMKWAFNSEVEISHFRQSLNFTTPPLNE